MPVKGYGQYCPISKAVEILGERWSMLVVRELLIGSRRFNDIARGVPGMSRTMLSKRLRQLETAGLVERVDGGYELTAAGAELQPIVFGMGEWAERWILTDPTDEEFDPDLLMWWAHSRLDTSPLPERRCVLEFRLTDDPRRYWVVSEHVGCSVCYFDPGFEVDGVVTTDLRTLHRMWQGRETPRKAVREGRVELSGQPALVRRLPQVLELRPLTEMGADARHPHLLQPPR